MKLKKAKYTDEEKAFLKRALRCPFCGKKAALHETSSPTGYEYEKALGCPGCPIFPCTNGRTETHLEEWNTRS